MLLQHNRLKKEAVGEGVQTEWPTLNGIIHIISRPENAFPPAARVTKDVGLKRGLVKHDGFRSKSM
jgi:hypothetical protein